MTFKSPNDEAEMKYLRENGTFYEENVFIDNGQLRSRFSKEQLENMLTAAGIRSARVEKLTEDLSAKGQQHTKELHLNEVIIEKL